MDNLWIYIRTLFEQDYAREENRFECVINSVKRGSSRCICIPGVAINYIANEMKFCTKTPECPNTWALGWDSENEAYFVIKNSADWNMGIPDLQKDEKDNSFDRNAEFCTETINGYTYIKIRKYDNIVSSIINPKMLFFELEGEINRKILLEFFILLTREFRTEMDMKDYVKMLFRFSFFLHPFSGIKILEQGDMCCKKFNYALLTEYWQMINKFKKQDLSSLERIKVVGDFIGADISMLYETLKDSNLQGDIRGINEFFQEQENITKKIANDSRLKNIMKTYKVS